jgi:hypothetical protein
VIEPIDETNFAIFAAKHYDNPQCLSTIEFLEDLSRFKYLKKLFNRYEESGELKERLILNHMIVLYNCFEGETTRMLFMKMPEYGKYLKPFVVYLNRMPEKIEDIGIERKTIISSDVGMDTRIVEALRSL